jgi:hypothetical protein
LNEPNLDIESILDIGELSDTLQSVQVILVAARPMGNPKQGIYGNNKGMVR